MPAAEIPGANLFAKYHSALSESGTALHSLESPEQYRTIVDGNHPANLACQRNSASKPTAYGSTTQISQN